MQVHTFIADSASDAVAQIRAQLGPQAVVLNVRPVPGEGLARLWQKRRIEVLAYLPEAEAPVSKAADALVEKRLETPASRQNSLQDASVVEPRVEGIGQNSIKGVYSRPETRSSSPPQAWRIGALLQNSGMLPIHAERVLDELRALHGDVPPATLAREMELTRALLRMLWNKPDSMPGLARSEGMHVLIGAPGVGKTVCLCKWLAQVVLLEGRPAQVWRLDGRTANTAEALSIYAEILNVPVERSLPVGPRDSSDLLLVDLPGVNWVEKEAVEQLGQQIAQMPGATVHLVLNAAYEIPILLSQIRAFSALPIADLIVTHLDEELRWGKLWNLALGTNFTLGYLSAGQNIPGAWILATPDEILTRQFPSK